MSARRTVMDNTIKRIHVYLDAAPVCATAPRNDVEVSHDGPLSTRHELQAGHRLSTSTVRQRANRVYA